MDFERSPDGLTSVLSEAGLEVAEATTIEWDWQVRPEDFWAGAECVGNFGVVWRAQSRGMQERMREAFDESAAQWVDGDHFVFPVSAAAVRATA